MNNIFKNISDKYSKMSKGNKRIADYILGNYEKVIFMTAAKLASITQVSESTVVRFANTIGFEGYPDFQSHLQEEVKSRLTTVQRLDFANANENINIAANSMYRDIENIKNTLAELEFHKISKAAKKIKNAKKIYILGFRSSKVLSEYLLYYLNFMLKDVQIITHSVVDVFDNLVNISEDDLVIAFSFPRYSKKTIDIVEYLKERNVEIVAITDSYNSPISKLTENVLIAKYNMETFIDSLVAPMSLMNALILVLSLEMKSELEQTFKNFESLWSKFNIYY
jgi:DNA-binding MurR/RpiR family transcriptional regulator